nr:hypothetical protein [Tanacetum cinerariifolium]
MPSHESSMSARDIKSLAIRHEIPLDLHPVALRKAWTMDKLSDDSIGLYEQYFQFSRIRIDRLVRSLLIQELPNDIYSLIDSNKTAKDLWDSLARHMLGSKYGKQDRKATVLYEYETFKATEGELLLDTYIRYLQVINNLKKCGYSKDNYELNFKFLNNLQPEWK